MSKLIQLRQRLRAIETIKKITHAMRLIAMSSHSELKQSQPIITSYTHTLESIFQQLRVHTPHWHHPILHPDQAKSKKIALIIVGSQKGLCGSFNNHLFKLVTRKLTELEGQEIDVIPVGQKVIDFVENLSIGQVKHSYKKFSIQRISKIANEITHSIFNMSPPYKSVFIISNRFKSFFVQYPKSIELIPVPENTIPEAPVEDDLIWEQKPQESLNDLAFSYIASQIQLLLFDSLLSEHAARFVSMDSATRNANDILEATKLEYNKLRQAKITKELTELTGSH
jgi:F-type H+-transporting ATPase subunit gamma